MLTAVRASISTPVCAVVSTVATICTPASPTSSTTSMLVSGSGWQSGTSSEVRLAAMMPASSAVARASPFGSERSAVAVSALIATRPDATARRRSCGLPPTSTMWTLPSASTWLRPCFAGISDRESIPRPVLDGVEVGELRVDPGGDVVLSYLAPDRREPPLPLVLAHGQRLVDRPCLAGEVEWVHGQRPFTQLVVGARVLGEDEDTVPGVHERRLLGDEVHAVEDRVHEQDVVLLVRGDGLVEVVLDPNLERKPALGAEAVVDHARGALDRAHVLGVLGDVLARRVEERKHPHAAVELRVVLQEQLVGAEAADDVLGRIRPVHPDDQELRALRLEPRLLLAHAVALREIGELCRIDGDGTRVDGDGPPLVRDPAGAEVALRAEHVLAATQEVPAPALGVEAHEVVGEHALVHRAADVLGKDSPVVGLRPRDVHEVTHRRVRRALPYETGRHIEVVVVEEDIRFGVARELLDDRVRKPVVDGQVPLRPREMEPVVDVWGLDEAPEVVLREPEDRVRDDVVIEVVRLRIVRDQP